MRTLRPRKPLLVCPLALALVLASGLLALAGAAPAAAQEALDVPAAVPDATPHASLAAANRRNVSFPDAVPASLFSGQITVAAPGTDLEIFGQDCCIRDDVVDVRIHRLDVTPRPVPCLLATIDSRGGATGTHEGERHRVSLGPGTYQVEYRMHVSGEGSSGWTVSEEELPFTNELSCRCASVQKERIQRHEVSLKSSEEDCDPSRQGPRTPIWGPVFGERRALEFDTGEKLEMACQSSRFEMLYTPPGGQRRLVGFCPFETGFNELTYEHFGDFDRDKKPDCLVATKWTSKDYGRNDDPNPFTGEVGERLLDWAVIEFEAPSGIRSDESYQFEYAQEPPILFRYPGREPEGRLVRQRFVEVIGKSGGRLAAAPGAGSGAFAGEPEPAPMVLGTVRPCDLTGDGSCDEADFERFRSALGACFEDAAYHPAADSDTDDCVDEADGEQLFGMIVDVDPGSVVNRINPRSNGAIHVAVLASDFGPNPALLDPDLFTFGATGTETSPDKFKYEDADGDGDLDLVLRFHTRGTGLACGDTVAWLAGETPEGEPVSSFDLVTTVGCPGTR